MYSVIVEGNQFAITRNGRTVIGPLALRDAMSVINELEFAPLHSNAVMNGAERHTPNQGSHADGEGQWGASSGAQLSTERNPLLEASGTIRELADLLWCE